MTRTARLERTVRRHDRVQRWARAAISSRVFPPVALMTVTAALAFTCLACESLWVDEASSYWISQLRGRDLYNIGFSYDAAMPLYYGALHLWLGFGHGEFAIRSLSVVCAVASVGCLFGLGSELFGRRAAFFGALLFAVGAPTIRYAQEARGYALVILLSICTVWAFVRALRRGAPIDWAVFGVAMLAAILTHPQAALLLPPLGLSLLMDRGPSRRRWLVLAIIVIGALPLLVRTISRLDLQLPDIPYLFALLFDPTASGDVFAAVSVVTLALGAVMLARRKRWVADHQADLALVAAWAFLPILLLWLISASLPIASGRYAAVSLAPRMLLVGTAIATFRPRVTRVVAAGALVVISSISVLGVLTVAHKEDWRGAAQVVADRAQVGDGIVFFSPGVAPAFSYYEGDHRTMPTHVYPYPGWRTTRWDKPQEPDLEETINANGVSFRGRSRIWFILSHYAATSPTDPRARDYPLINALLHRDYRRVDIGDISVRGVGISLFERKPNA